MVGACSQSSTQIPELLHRQASCRQLVSSSGSRRVLHQRGVKAEDERHQHKTLSSAGAQPDRQEAELTESSFLLQEKSIFLYLVLLFIRSHIHKKCPPTAAVTAAWFLLPVYTPAVG